MLYLGTSDLPIYRFDKIHLTGNLAYLIIEWNERDKVNVPDEAVELWENILDSWHKKTQNNEALIRSALVSEIDYLERRLYVVSALISCVNEKNKEAFGAELNAWGVKFNSKAKVANQRKGLEKQIRAAKMRIDIKKSELDQLTNDGEQISILKQKIKLERQLGIKIDLKTTPVDEWLMLYEELLELKEDGKRNTHN